MLDSPTEQILFVDLGRVTCFFNQQARLLEISNATGMSPERLDDLFWKSGFDTDCDSGKYTAAEICNHIRDKSGVKLDDRILATLWATAFAPNQTIISLLNQLKGRFTRVLLTDNSPLIEMGLPFVAPEIADCFEHRLFSYGLGGLKRDPDTFRRALDRLGASPAGSFLIDDNSSVLQAAKALGIGALAYRHDDDLPAIKAALGISL